MIVSATHYKRHGEYPELSCLANDSALPIINNNSFHIKWVTVWNLQTLISLLSFRYLVYLEIQLFQDGAKNTNIRAHNSQIQAFNAKCNVFHDEESMSTVKTTPYSTRTVVVYVSN